MCNIVIDADIGSSLAQIVCSLPAVTAVKITAIDVSIQVSVHPSFFAGLSASTKLQCLDVSIDTF